MITKKIIIPVALVILILIVLKIVLIPSKVLNTTQKEEKNVEIYKTSVIKIGEKELNLALIKNDDNGEVLSTPYSLAVLSNGKVDYSSQVINGDLLEDFESIKTKVLDNETLIVVDGLSVGAHSSGLRVFKINQDKKQIIPVCVSTDKQTKDDPCLFYTDAMTEPFFDDVDKDGIDELVEMNKNLKDTQVNVLTAVYKYKNNSFIPLTSKEYETAYQYLLKSFKGDNNQVFKLIRNTENKI
ncbi:MAG: hypothetical protein WC895_02170 [Candidatus Shapirobacteria bacterium]|jgi:hypothetical protein